MFKYSLPQGNCTISACVRENKCERFFPLFIYFNPANVFPQSACSVYRTRLSGLTEDLSLILIWMGTSFVLRAIYVFYSLLPYHFAAQAATLICTGSLSLLADGSAGASPFDAMCMYVPSSQSHTWPLPPLIFLPSSLRVTYVWLIHPPLSQSATTYKPILLYAFSPQLLLLLFSLLTLGAHVQREL